MTIFKLPGTSIVSNTITTTQLVTTVVNQISQGGGPKVSGITYPNSATAAANTGSETVVLTGTGFESGVQIYINGNAVPSVTRTNSNSVSFTTAALSSATYPVYVVNPDGATAILIPGMQVSGKPVWITTSPLTSWSKSAALSRVLQANSDSSVTYALADGSSLPSGITLAANGLLSGTLSSPPADTTTYNFTVVATDAEGQTTSSAFSIDATAIAAFVNDANTILLIHADGANNSTTFTDDNASGVRSPTSTVGAGGGVKISTAQYKFGTGSAVFDGSGDHLTATIPNGAPQQGDITIELWARFNALPSTGSGGYMIITSCSGAEPYILVSNNGSGNPSVSFGFNGKYGTASLTSTTITTNTWYHIAAVRYNGTWKVYWDGVDMGTINNDSNWNTLSSTFEPLASTTFFGKFSDDRGSWNGYMDEIRVSKVARYTSNFTPGT
jgi:hypothetical protein